MERVDQDAVGPKLNPDDTYFKDLIDSSPAVVWMTDENSQCTYLSRRWYEYTGRTPEQDLGIGWLENIHPDDLAETARVYSNAVRNMGPLDVDYRLRARDGRYRWQSDIGNPRFHSDGRFAGYIGTVTDIHDRKLAEIELAQTQERFRRSTEATDLGVWYCDLPFDELIWNKEVKNHFFLPPDARVTIETFYERIHPDDREITRQAIETSNIERTPYNIVYRTTHPHDLSRIKHIRAVGWTDYSLTGQPIRFDGITLDVTAEVLQNEEAHRLRDEANEARIEAERANETKSAFLANMSHEIRTPLGAILGFADLLSETSSADERAEFARTIERNGRALTRLVDDILDLSKVEAGRLEIEAIDFELKPFLDDVVMLFGEAARTKGLNLTSTIDADVPARIQSDPTRIRQILVNLIGNAVKFTPSGRIEVRITRGASVGPVVALEFRVQDTGIGMSDDQLARLFQPFVQADNTMTRQFGGTGLGLALSRRLAQALGGTVKIVECQKERGCTFAAFIEVRMSSAESVDKPAVAARSEAGGRALRVLLVEDSVDNQFLVTRFLAKKKIAVDIAENGREGAKAALAENYDVILMDMQMPVLDGYAATAQLRAQAYRRPIIALTAHAMAEERERILKVGCDEHLTKPLDFDRLLATIYRFARASENENADQW